MFQLATRRAISLSLSLTASLVFQTVPMLGTGFALAQKKTGQRAPVSSSQPGLPADTAPTQPIVTQKGGAPLAGTPTIVAAKVDAWDDTATPDGKAEPGQTITYTVTIQNTGMGDATGVTFTDTVDP